MIRGKSQESSFALVGEGRDTLPDLLQAVFQHPWVATYQVGFGPPLVRSSSRIIERLKSSRTAVDRMRAYFEVCVLEEEERLRLIAIHRKQLVRQHGPIEAEALDAASVDAIDLTLRLHIPHMAPPQVADAMKRADVEFAEIAVDTPPENLTVRFPIRLTDPFQERILHLDLVRRVVTNTDRSFAVELRVPVKLRSFVACWLGEFERRTGYRSFDLEDPLSHARIYRDGKKN